MPIVALMADTYLWLNPLQAEPEIVILTTADGLMPKLGIGLFLSQLALFPNLENFWNPHDSCGGCRRHNNMRCCLGHNCFHYSCLDLSSLICWSYWVILQISTAALHVNGWCVNSP
ncbi:hypothetical protein MKW98_006694 [Papaver atlanticum]|uniref:Uncharacterized protein n=1 Tax=Papaver atlanticum TaxID=357466 RepID=A0AAD4T065_9MAGN|nr:hypothetical protein MKW98_006694 [Papaver atlanticum]